MSLLQRIEAVLEARLPIGVRPRQCSLRTLLVGMHLCLATGHQSAHLSAVHAALCGLEPADQARLGVVAEWKAGPHRLTYRQLTYTTERLCAALAKDRPDGASSDCLQELCDALIEGSVPSRYKEASGSYAIDWTDVSSFSRPPSDKDGPCADPEAAWGHRRGDGLPHLVPVAAPRCLGSERAPRPALGATAEPSLGHGAARRAAMDGGGPRHGPDPTARVCHRPGAGSFCLETRREPGPSPDPAPTGWLSCCPASVAGAAAGELHRGRGGLYWRSGGIHWPAILAQAAVAVLDGDTPDSLHARIQAEEHRLYPATLARMAGEGFRLDGQRVIWEKPQPR